MSLSTGCQWKSLLEKGVIAGWNFGHWLQQLSLKVIRCVSKKKIEHELLYGIITRIYPYWKWNKSVVLSTIMQNLSSLSQCCEKLGTILLPGSEHKLTASIEPLTGWIYSWLRRWLLFLFEHSIPRQSGPDFPVIFHIPFALMSRR